MKRIQLCILTVLVISAYAYGKNQIDLLLENLNSDTNYKVKIASALKLGKISNGSVAAHLSSAYKKQTNKAVRFAIIQAISQIPDSQALVQLLYLKNSAFLNKNEKTILAQTLWSYRSVIDEQSWIDHYEINSKLQKKLDALWVLSAVESSFIEENITFILANSKRPSFTAGALETLIYFNAQAYQDLCKSYSKKENPRISLKAKMCLQAAKKPSAHKKQINQEILQTQSSVFTAQFFESYKPSKKSSKMMASSVLASIDKSAGLSHKNNKFTDISFKEKKVFTEDYDLSNLDKLQSYGGELELIRNSIKKNMHLFQPCYQSISNQDSPLKGKLNMEFVVASSGKMRNLRYVKNSISNKKLQNCFANSMKQVQFDQINLKSIKVQYTFSFR